LTIWQPVRKEEVLCARELESLPAPREDEPLGVAHRRQLEEIFAALREGREPPVPGEEARKAVEIILGIYGAAASVKRITFPLQ
jgi:UDP-N-acetyl-2-amino-2-deoxyglucuronate dehydrogenase